MTTTAKLAGQDTKVQVDLEETFIKNIKDSAIQEFLDMLITQYSNDYTETEDVEDLNEDELNQLTTKYACEILHGLATLAENIAFGELRLRVESDVKDIIKDRTKYFTFTVPYSGEFKVCVKARSEQEALDHLDGMYQGEFEDYIRACDTSIEVDDAVLDFANTAERAPSEYIDATED